MIDSHDSRPYSGIREFLRLETSHWRQAVLVFDRDRPVRRGEHVELAVGHSDSGFRFHWPEPAC